MGRTGLWCCQKPQADVARTCLTAAALPESKSERNINPPHTSLMLVTVGRPQPSFAAHKWSPGLQRTANSSRPARFMSPLQHEGWLHGITMSPTSR